MKRNFMKWTAVMFSVAMFALVGCGDSKPAGDGGSNTTEGDGGGTNNNNNNNGGASVKCTDGKTVSLDDYQDCVAFLNAYKECCPKWTAELTDQIAQTWACASSINNEACKAAKDAWDSQNLCATYQAQASCK